MLRYYCRNERRCLLAFASFLLMRLYLPAVIVKMLQRLLTPIAAAIRCRYATPLCLLPLRVTPHAAAQKMMMRARPRCCAILRFDAMFCQAARILSLRRR